MAAWIETLCLCRLHVGSNRWQCKGGAFIPSSTFRPKGSGTICCVQQGGCDGCSNVALFLESCLVRRLSYPGTKNTGFQMCCILWWPGIDLRPHGRSLVMMAINHYPVMDELFFRGTAKVSFKTSFCGNSSVWLALRWSLTAGLLQSREMLLEPEIVGSSIPKRVKVCDFLSEYIGFMK